MPSHYLGVISKYEKNQETAAIEKSHFSFMTSQNGSIKTEIKSSKLFELKAWRN